MLVQILYMLLCALLSSAITLGVAWYLFTTRWRPRLLAEIREREDQLEKRLQAYGREIEGHVSRGIVEGVNALSSPEAVRERTRTIAQTGVDLMADGLSAFLSGRRED